MVGKRQRTQSSLSLKTIFVIVEEAEGLLLEPGVALRYAHAAIDLVLETKVYLKRRMSK